MFFPSIFINDVLTKELLACRQKTLLLVSVSQHNYFKQIKHIDQYGTKNLLATSSTATVRNGHHAHQTSFNTTLTNLSLLFSAL